MDSQDKSATELLTNFTQAYKRYWRIALAPAIILFGLTLMVSYTVPDYYTSDALLFIQPQRISSKIIDAPNKEETREWLEALVQEILSRPRLRAVIERFDMYPQMRGPLGMEQAVQRFRKKIVIKPMVSPTGIELLQTFRLTFTHQDPQLAFDVTKALSDLFVEESVLEKRSEIQSTEEFLDAQLREARKRLEETEEKVQEFVSANAGQLPDQLASSVARLESLQAQLSNNSQLLAATSIRRSSLIAELADAEKMSASMPFEPGQTNSSDPNESLAQLESALVVLQSKYSEQHPDVIHTRNRIQALKQQMASGGVPRVKSPVNTARASTLRNLRNSIQEIDVQINNIKVDNERLKNSIARLQENIAAAPLKEQEMLKIKRDYDNVKDNYQRLLAAKEDASLRNSLVRSQKDTQFKIVEPAELPASPAGPNRMLIVIGGLFVSVALFFGLVLTMFFFNASFKSREELEEETGLTVLGVIPPMATSDALEQEKRLARASLAASVFSLASGSVLIYVVFNYVVI